MPCPPGTWGFGCNASCQCAHEAACSPQTGACTCTPGWHGAHCQLPCPVSVQPPACLGGGEGTTSPGLLAGPTPRPSLRRGSLVKAVPVAVTVSMLTAAILFTDTASARLGGQVSLMVGGPQAYRGVGGMYPTGHVCRESLWMRRGDTGQAHPTPLTGTRCHQPCPEGFWGANCSNTCTCKNGGTCIPKNGNCICAPGFRGPSCQKCEALSPPPAFQSSVRCQKPPL